MGTEAAGRPSGLDRWRLVDGIRLAQELIAELRRVGMDDEADAAKRIRDRLQARRDGLSYVGPTGRLVEP